MSLGRPGDDDEDIVVRIKADAPVLRPDEPAPAHPVLQRGMNVPFGGFFCELFSC